MFEISEKQLKNFCKEFPNTVVIDAIKGTSLLCKASRHFAGHDYYTGGCKTWTKYLPSLLRLTEDCKNHGNSMTAGEVAARLWPDEFKLHLTHEMFTLKVDKSLEVIDKLIAGLPDAYKRGFFFNGELKNTNFLQDHWNNVKENLK